MSHTPEDTEAAAGRGGRPGRALSTALLYAQRNRPPLPAALRRLARGGLQRSLDQTPGIEGWSTQPFGGGPLRVAPTRALEDGGQLDGGRDAGDGPPLLCLVVTGILDVGG